MATALSLGGPFRTAEPQAQAQAAGGRGRRLGIWNSTPPTAGPQVRALAACSLVVPSKGGYEARADWRAAERERAAGSPPPQTASTTVRVRIAPSLPRASLCFWRHELLGWG